MLEDIRDSLSGNGKTYAIIAGVLGVLLVTGFFFSSAGLNSANSQEDLGYTTDSSGGAPMVNKQSASLDRSKNMAGGSGGDSVEVERKQITTIHMSFEVPEVIDAQARTELLTEEFGGWVEGESLNRHDGDRGSMQVRVPQNNLSEFLNELETESGWKLDSKNRNTDDVTDRYTELSLELKNKRQELNRLENMMNRTEEVDSLIKIQERMSELRSRIQYLENQLNDIDQRVNYVRIDINFDEPRPITSEFELREAVRDSYRGIFDSLNLIIVGAGHLLPFGLIAAVIYWIRKYLRERREE